MGFLGDFFDIVTHPFVQLGTEIGNVVSGSEGKTTGTPNPPPPKAPSPIDQAAVEFAAEQKQAKPQGRAANILSGPNGSLLAPSNLYSASKQLLGS